MSLPIYTPTKEEVHSGELGRALRGYNYRHIGEYGEAQPVWLNARDGELLAGGLRGYVMLGWMFVDLLWVHDDHRGQRLGSRLLAEAESRAIGLGARHVRLETFAFQARGFYEKQGYTEYAWLDDYVGGQHLSLMRKQLAAH
jgi:GNAT superfamily N-acetyltransferase